MRVIAGSDRCDRSVEILDNRAFQILRLEAFAGPTAGGRAMIAEGASHTIIIAGSR